MTARKIRVGISEDWKNRIRVGVILERLQRHATTEGDELPQSRIKAMEILLRKSLPDLSATTMDATAVVATRKLTTEEELQAKEALLRYAITHGGIK